MIQTSIQCLKIQVRMIVQSRYHTKHWRKLQPWYFTGRHNECEKYQMRCIEQIIHGKRVDDKLQRSTFRLNLFTNEIQSLSNPLLKNNGYEWTENFDAQLQTQSKLLLFNLKFIVGEGGAQTRSLREVYHFIRTQLTYLKCNPTTNICFINILDGDACEKSRSKFVYLLSKFNDKQNIFVGDMFEFQQKQHEYIH